MKPWTHTEVKSQYWIFLDGTLRVGWGPDALFEYNRLSSEEVWQTPWGVSGWQVFEQDARMHPAWNDDVADQEKELQKEEFQKRYQSTGSNLQKTKGKVQKKNNWPLQCTNASVFKRYGIGWLAQR